MELDPKAKALLTAIAAAGVPSIESVPLAQARELVENGMRRMKIPVRPVGAISEVQISVENPTESIPLRIYTPSAPGPYPVILFFHGGGWVFFNVEDYDPICTHLCEASGCLVVSVGYRRSPEYKFPSAVNDCYRAALFTAGHCADWGGDPEHIFISGDSAGGNLAAVTALRIRDEGGPPVSGQILIYPVTDHFLHKKTSAGLFAEGYNLSSKDMEWFWEKYLQTAEEGRSHLASPLLASTHTGLPPALVIVSGFDPLRDEGLEYAEKLTRGGVSVKLLVYKEMIHGFLSYLGILKQGKAAIGEIAAWIKNNLQ
jgi:acetyl esterase